MRVSDKVAISSPPGVRNSRFLVLRSARPVDRCCRRLAPLYIAVFDQYSLHLHAFAEMYVNGSLSLGMQRGDCLGTLCDPFRHTGVPRDIIQSSNIQGM